MHPLRKILIGIAYAALLVLTSACAPRDLQVTPAAHVTPVAEAAPAAATGLAPAEFWCAAYRPHGAADALVEGGNYWHWMAPGVTTARCVARHSTSVHYYHVTVWDQDGDGVIELSQWTPLSWATW